MKERNEGNVKLREGETSEDETLECETSEGKTSEGQMNGRSNVRR